MIRIFGRMKGRDILLVLCCVLLVCGQVYFDLKLPDYTAEITVLISSGVTVLSDYFVAGGRMLLCALGSALLTVGCGYVTALVAADFSYDIRGQVFNKVASFGDGEIKKFSTASLITRTTNDITQIEMIIAMGLSMIMRAPIMAVWAIIKIVGKSFELTMIVAAGVVIIVLTVVILLIVLIPKFRIIQGQIDDVNRISRENLDGIRVIRAYNAEDYQESKFEKVSEKLMRTQIFTGRGTAFLWPIMTFVQSGLTLAIYYVGAILINNIEIPLNGTAEAMAMAAEERSVMLGTVVSFSSYGMYVIMSFLMLLMMFMMLPRAAVSAGRINEVLDQKVDVREGTEETAPETGSIVFDHVSFRYPDASEDCLKDISFTAKKGETVAVIGATGSGKSTLVNLIARLYDASSGKVMIDGKDISKFSFESLYNKVALIPQKATLFADSVYNNVRFGKSEKEVTREDADQAIDIAQSTDFVSELENGIDSPISQSGTNVSGGQKQRLTIARAIARKPEILVFDDSFSALDYKTDKNLRKRISSELKDTTCFIVAQRIGTIRNADKILVLDNGELVGAGTHDELMKNCQVYREIALSQLSESELAQNA